MTPQGQVSGLRGASAVVASRRLVLRVGGAAAMAGALGGLGTSAQASQLEEPLADSVRSMLSAAISNSAPPVPVFSDEASKRAYEQWLAVMDARLVRRKANDMERTEFLQTIWYEAKRAGLEVSLVLGVVQVESAFRKYAISPVGARGYMQVMPFWTRVIGDGDPGKLFHMQTNLRFGCVILRHYLDRERGDTFMALGRYNGSRGRDKYPNLVYAAEKNWLMPSA